MTLRTCPRGSNAIGRRLTHETHTAASEFGADQLAKIGPKIIKANVGDQRFNAAGLPEHHPRLLGTMVGDRHEPHGVTFYSPQCPPPSLGGIRVLSDEIDGVPNRVD